MPDQFPSIEQLALRYTIDDYGPCDENKYCEIRDGRDYFHDPRNRLRSIDYDQRIMFCLKGRTSEEPGPNGGNFICSECYELLSTWKGKSSKWNKMRLRQVTIKRRVP